MVKGGKEGRKEGIRVGGEGVDGVGVEASHVISQLC